jgi:hypothetical protein
MSSLRWHHPESLTIRAGEGAAYSSRKEVKRVPKKEKPGKGKAMGKKVGKGAEKGLHKGWAVAKAAGKGAEEAACAEKPEEEEKED